MFQYSIHVLLLFLLILPLLQIPARPTPKFTPEQVTVMAVKDINHAWQEFKSFRGARRGTRLTGISDLKKYFHRFGYLPATQDGNFTDEFDARLEQAVARYQVKHGLPESGELTGETINQITAPRCGVPDDPPPLHGMHETRNYAYFAGRPRWTRSLPMTLTYAFSPEHRITSLTLSDIKATFKRSFSRWASVIPVTFSETDDYGFADIKIGFYSGDHGDGEPFDGVLGILAHAFSPESGRFHLDAAETWAVDFGSEKSEAAVDLESVAIHEIGHLLGLAHSSVKGSIMYPSLKPRNQKLEMKVDDIKGIQALYGSNPNFNLSASLESAVTSSSQAAAAAAIDSKVGSPRWHLLVMIISLLLASN
ncbi:metalloendoproteinase 4-MMP-like [Diospyros lotus]|uniref:metalloendoproteinase 4-MMP-like n=1 Tax=Diospyros lotus TaxID=55363 RepID=UPI0022581CDA|nr:metalloendoproteinase 4-MMP-like [Diospyros lotus]